jgi:ribosomal protein L16 Arg81 hydroxylase
MDDARFEARTSDRQESRRVSEALARADMPPSRLWDLAALVSPLPGATFTEEYWERRPLHVSRGDAAYFARLFTMEDADAVLADTSVDPSSIRMVRDGDEIPVTDLVWGGGNRRHVALEALYTEYRSGATIVLQFLNERWKPLRDLCRSLSAAFSAGVLVNVYITPAGQQGLQRHYDTHDVFVLQVAGSKRWRLYNTPIPLPLESTPFRRDQPPATGEPTSELVVSAGDTLYVPRGCIHEAESDHTTSIHLTVGMHTVKVASLLRGALEDVIAADPELRRSLPIGYLRDANARAKAREHLLAALDSAWSGLDPDRMLEEADRLALCATQPALDGHLLDLERADTVDLSTIVGRRPGVVSKVDANKDTNDKVTLAFHGKVLTLPAYVEPQIAYVMVSERFSAQDLPGPLDEAGKLTLVRRLVREGLLTCVSHQPG